MNAKFVLRITAPMIAVSLLLLAVGVVSAWYVHSLQKENSELLALDVASMLTAEDLEIKMREVRSSLNRYLRAGDSQYLKEIPALHESTEKLLVSAKQAARADREVAFISEIEQGCRHFFSAVDRARRSESPELQIADLLWDSSMERGIFRPTRAYIDYHRKIVERTSRQSQIMADRMGLGLLLLGICGSAAGLVAGFGIARGVSRSIVQLSVPVHGAAGKLNEVVGPITLSATAGFEELESALEDMADHIGTVVERLEQREREVLRGEQLAAVGQLAAGIAHEVRNPLMAMKILVQSAAERGDGALRGRDLAVVDEEIGRLENSIQALLDFARPPQPEKAALDLRQVVAQTVDLVSARAEQQHVSLAMRLPEQPAMVEIDGGQIRQVLLNLLLNALDALPNGGLVRLEVAADTGHSTPADLHDDYVLRIVDNGQGLPPELGDRIFEPFFSTKETGTGLGLPISRRIIDAHGGEIHAANVPQGGAEFVIRLPRAEGALAGSLVASGVEPFTLHALEVTHAATARS